MEPFSQIEIRVLGVLIEKGIATPDYYPLTLNALTAGCNQKSNRHPVVEVDEKTVARALESLREERALVRVVSGADIRVPKYYHLVAEEWQLDDAQIAVVCELMLRGPQTVGELRGHCNRLFSFADLGQVESTLETLMARQQGALAVKLPRQPGRKESRFAHLLAGEPEAEPAEAAEPPVEKVVLAMRADDERLERLEQTVEELQRQMAALQQRFDDFKREFE